MDFEGYVYPWQLKLEGRVSSLTAIADAVATQPSTEDDE